MRLRTLFASAFAILFVTVTARADDAPAARARVWDPDQTLGGLALFAASYTFAASMGALSYRRTTEPYPPGVVGPPATDMAIPVFGPYISIFRKDGRLDQQTLLSLRVFHSGLHSCAEKDGYCGNGFGLWLGLILYLPELGVLLGAQTLGLGMVLAGFGRTKPAASGPTRATPKLSLTPMALQKGAGVALSVAL